MENRTILAFVLSFLVLIGWSMLFGPKQKHAPEKVTNTNKQVVEGLPDVQHPSNISHNDLSQGSAEGGPGPEVEEREITVDTPLYTACFTNVGPALKSFKLKQYRQDVDPDSPMVELFAHKRGRDDSLAISFDNTAATGGMEGGKGKKKTRESSRKKEETRVTGVEDAGEEEEWQVVEEEE
jgi:YidC/Oxa1 family membrane protein insertase